MFRLSGFAIGTRQRRVMRSSRELMKFSLAARQTICRRSYRSRCVEHDAFNQILKARSKIKIQPNTNMNVRLKFSTLVSFAIFAIGFSGYVGNGFGAEQSSEAKPSPAAFDGGKTLWHGFDRYDFVMDEQTLAITPFIAPAGEGSGVKDPPKGQRRCIVVAPKMAAPGNPWSWRGCYWDHQSQAEVELLKRGFHIAYTSANQNLKPGKEWDAWYEFLTKHGLSLKPAFIGMSRGGEFSYIWATTHPDKVSCIYADNTGGNQENLARLGELASHDVPLLHVNGSLDPILGKYSTAIENIYRQFGGRISVMIKEGPAHHPHSLRDPT